jgi:hypothetical protein
MQQCRYDAKTVFRAMFSRHGPDGLVSCFPRFNARYFDFGKFAATSPGPNRVRLEAADIPAYAFIFIGPMHLAYAEESMRIVGARAPSTELQSVEPAGKSGEYTLVRSHGEVRWR